MMISRLSIEWVSVITQIQIILFYQCRLALKLISGLSALPTRQVSFCLMALSNRIELWFNLAIKVAHAE